jgi:PiT family inorganic phosphate transporter
MNLAMSLTADTADALAERPELDRGLGRAGAVGFAAATLAAVLYVIGSVYGDASAAGVDTRVVLPFLLLFVALLIALGFEFVNGFHDTANAVATVIYTNAMPAQVAVVWSGFCSCSPSVLLTDPAAPQGRRARNRSPRSQVLGAIHPG